MQQQRTFVYTYGWKNLMAIMAEDESVLLMVKPRSSSALSFAMDEGTGLNCHFEADFISYLAHLCLILTPIGGTGTLFPFWGKRMMRLTRYLQCTYTDFPDVTRTAPPPSRPGP